MTTNVFEKDLGGLENFANNLIKIIETEACINKIINESGAVISLDAKFGMGKTHFLQMFENHLKTKDFDCFFIDAWKSDFYNSPLLVIICELINYLETKEKNITTTLITSLKIAGAVCVSGLKQILQHTTGVDLAEIVDTAKNVEEQKFDIILKNYQEHKESLENIKINLTKYTTGLSKPLVILVDELDRAKPSYAVEFLEAIKHFFDVKNIVFMLAVNKEQIEQSVKCLYGNIDFNEYYRKFATRNVQLPYFLEKKYQSYLEAKYNEILKEFALSDHYTTCILILFLKLSPRQINEFLRILYCSKNHIDIPRHSYHYNNFLFIFTIHTIISVYDLNITKKIAENAYDWSVFFEKLNTEGDIDNKKFINSIMQFLIVAMSRTDFEIYITKHDDSRFKLNVEELRSFHCTYVSKNQEFAQIILNIQNQTVA
jgi:hypothetical protein